MVTPATLSPTLSIRPEALTAKQAAQAVLCLELSGQRLRITLLDRQGQLVWLDEYAHPSLLVEQSLLPHLPALFSEHALLSYDQFEHIRVALVTPPFTLIPADLYRKEYAGNYLSLMRGHQPPPNELAQAYTHAEGFVSVFGVDRALTEFLNEQYPMQPITYVHQQTALIEATRVLDLPLPPAPRLFLYFEEEQVTLLFRDNRQLRYCNRFGFKNVQDLTYYVLYVLDELGADPDTVSALVYGEVTPFAESYVSLSRFVAQLRIGTAPPTLSLSDAVADLPGHRYVSLQGLCLLT